MSNEYEVAVAPVAAALELIGVEYYLAGSVISSLFGVMRTTADVDVVAALRREHAGPFAQQLVNDYYADEDMRQWAVDLGVLDLLERALKESKG